ncbi:MAG: Ig-like domain-containing protein [Verrucomicrobiota bacterium]
MNKKSILTGVIAFLLIPLGILSTQLLGIDDGAANAAQSMEDRADVETEFEFDAESGNLLIKWFGHAQRVYQITRADSMNDPKLPVGFYDGEDAEIVYEEPRGEGAFFEVLSFIDLDSDSLPDSLEQEMISYLSGMGYSGLSIEDILSDNPGDGEQYLWDANLNGISNFDEYIAGAESPAVAVAVADATPPSIAALSPADDSVKIAVNQDLTITFDEEITAGFGMITIKNLTDATESLIDITDGTQVAIAGSSLTVSPTAMLDTEKDYAIQIGSTAIEDLSGNPFSGISEDETWNFTTGPADVDEDGLPDEWEEQIILFSSEDEIETIYDVHPEEDFDGDELNNAKEYEWERNPTLSDVQGLFYHYYEKSGMEVVPNFEELNAVKKGVARNASLELRERGNHFAFRFEGFLQVDMAGEYTITLRSNEGSNLYIEDELAIDNDGINGYQTRHLTRHFAKGRHQVRVEYFERVGGQTLTWSWKGPGTQNVKVPIPDEALFLVDLFDSDGDGLYDSEEFQLGTDPNLADTDGDGYSDYQEVREFLSDPLVPDLSEYNVLDTIPAASSTQTYGQWGTTDDGAMVSQTVKGTLQFEISVPADGVYQLEFEAQSAFNDTPDDHFPVKVLIDGILIDQVNLVLQSDGTLGLARVTTPWISAGTHTVEFFYDNTYSYRRIQVNALRLLEIQGLDADGNGIDDWVETRLEAINSLENNEATGPVKSYVSPFQVYGYSRFFEMFSLNVAEQDPEINRAPGTGWYADVELDPAEAVTIEASFENGVFTEQVEVEWVALNLLDEDMEAPQTLRAGSKLRLTAIPDGMTVEGGDTLMTLTVDDGTTTTPVPIDEEGDPSGTVEFAGAGTYTLTGTYDHPTDGPVSNSVTIEVVDGQLNGDPVVGRNLAYTWDNPELPGGLPIEVDHGILLNELGALPDGGYQFSLISWNFQTSYLAARLENAENEGEILDTATVTTISAASNESTSVDFWETYADGSELIGTPIILSEIPAGIVIEVEIFQSGTTFDDGTILKTFTADDFDEFNRIYVKFIKAPWKGANCHQIHLYIDGEYLGKL